MYQQLRRRLHAVSSLGSNKSLTSGKKGLEKESLRVTPAGTISRADHPRLLGSALTHPSITTDYSEALLELITPPFERSGDALAFLERTHRYVYSALGDDMLWVTSMPCAVVGDESVPIAKYGTSNSGMMRHIYRRGLAHRYGRVMQVISGVHYNYSVGLDFWPEYREIAGHDGPLESFISEEYFAQIRNVHRYTWLLIYLFGSSPALCRSFLGPHAERFDTFDESTRFAPYATSLRMSDIGYTNSSQTSLNVVYDDLNAYVTSLTDAIETPHPPYAEIGVRVDGEYRQLNSNILQIENEFYSPVRPKQLAERGEKPTVALARRGVAYVEVRSLDVNPFAPAGVEAAQLDFLEVFMLFCLMQQSPAISGTEKAAIESNNAQTAEHGRAPGLSLSRNGDDVSLQAWGKELLNEMVPLAEALGPDATNALKQMQARVDDPEQTPSARMLREMRASGASFFQYGLELSKRTTAQMQADGVDQETRDEYTALASASLAEQLELEQSDDVSFEAYLERYFSPDDD